MKKKSVNPAMAMMAARAMRTPSIRPSPMGMPQVAPNAMSTPPGMPPMPGMKKGGMMKSDSKEDKKMDMAQDKAMVKKAFKMHDKQEHKGEHTDLSKLRKGGMMKMAKGGETMGPRTMSKDVEKGSNKLTKFGQSAVQKRGNTRGKNLGDSGPTVKPKTMCKGGYAKGGSASSRADGIASKGKTKGKFC
jgi:hypothetical protein